LATKAEEVTGKPITILFPPDRQYEEQEILARIRRGDSSRMNQKVHVRFCEGLGVKFPGPTRSPNLQGANERRRLIPAHTRRQSTTGVGGGAHTRSQDEFLHHDRGRRVDDPMRRPRSDERCCYASTIATISSDLGSTITISSPIMKYSKPRHAGSISTMVCGRAMNRTLRGTRVPTDTMKFTLLIRGAFRT
jgi:hypothetical protein